MDGSSEDVKGALDLLFVDCLDTNKTQIKRRVLISFAFLSYEAWFLALTIHLFEVDGKKKI